MPPSRLSRSDVFDPEYCAAISHELGALVVENEQVSVGRDEIGIRAHEELGDVKPAFADLTESIGGDRGAADAVLSHRSL